MNIASRIVEAGLTALAALALAAPALAQAPAGSVDSDYASVAGWRVVRVADAAGRPLHCAAGKFGPSGEFRLTKLNAREWAISVPASGRRPGRFTVNIGEVLTLQSDGQRAWWVIPGAPGLGEPDREDDYTIDITPNATRTMEWVIRGAAQAIKAVERCHAETIVASAPAPAPAAPVAAFCVGGLSPVGPDNFLVVREQPSSNAPWHPDIKLRNGDRVQVLGAQGDFYRVRLGDGFEGWSGRRFIAPCAGQVAAAPPAAPSGGGGNPLTAARFSAITTADLSRMASGCSLSFERGKDLVGITIDDGGVDRKGANAAMAFWLKIDGRLATYSGVVTRDGDGSVRTWTAPVDGNQIRFVRGAKDPGVKNDGGGEGGLGRLEWSGPAGSGSMPVRWFAGC